MSASRVRRWAFVALPVLGIAELVAHVWFSTRPPSFDDWSATEPMVRQARQTGDVVVIAPEYAEPDARRVLGDDLMPLRDVARGDVTRYAHAVELSILGQHARELAGWREEGRWSAGKFLVRRLANPAPVTVLYDFTDHVAPPSADVRVTDPPADCKWNPSAPLGQSGTFGHPIFPRQRFECPGGPFFNVGVTVIGDQDFRARRCVWSHPPGRGEVVTRFHHVPLGRTIHGHSGIYWLVEREKRGAPISVTVRVDGQPIGSFTHTDGEGWAAFDLDVGAHANAPDAEVEFAVTTSRNFERHFCLEALSLGDAR